MQEAGELLHFTAIPRGAVIIAISRTGRSIEIVQLLAKAEASGAANIQWNRNTEWVRKNLLNRIEKVGEGKGWIEERTGLHELEFIATRRHWFSFPVGHDACAGVHVLNLVEGEEAIVESPSAAFEPFHVHYAETFIVPAQTGRYSIRPADGVRQCATIRAAVRTKP